MASTVAVVPEVAPLTSTLPSRSSRHLIYETTEEQDRALHQFIQEQQEMQQEERERERLRELAEELEPPTVSRYRSLRGKSVSSVTRRKAFDVYSDSQNLPPGDAYPQLDSPTIPPRSALRRRAKSMASVPGLILSSSPGRPPSILPPMPPSRPSSSASCSKVPSPNRSEDAPASPGAKVRIQESVAGVIGGLVGGKAPRAAVGALGNGPQVRHASPSPTSTNRKQAPSAVSHPLPSLSLIPKPTNVPSSAIALVRKASRSRIRTRTPSPGPDSKCTKSKAKSKSKSRTRSKSKTKSTPTRPKTATSLATSPNDEVARRKAFNLFSFRANVQNTARASQPTRDEPDHRTQAEREEAERWAAEVARLEAETDRILAEQRKLDLARYRAQVATPPRLTRFLSIEKLPFLSRGRWSNASQNGTPSPTAPTIISVDLSRSSFEDSALSDKMSFIEQGGRGIVPNFDAPTSASNGGERRVTVRCLSSTINLPVTPETSPVDLLFSTANLTSHNIDPKSSVLIECYVELGLERRLRRYERIRDVMNSWDRDQQNSLLVLTMDLSGNDSDSELDIQSVPRTPSPPAGFTLQLYHSSRPGKWNKRWITLLETGQMFAAKKPDAKASDKDSHVLCHLSDFDIYTPRESEVRRHLKAPRRFCYAVKSQQKTFVFPNGENFVHFFCAEDAQLARRFFELIQKWRSWYLVTKHIDFEKKETPYERVVSEKPPRISHSSCPAKKAGTSSSSSTTSSGGHRLKVSVDQSPYTIGAFQPLLDLNRFDKPLDEFGKDLEPAQQAEPRQKVLTKKAPRTLITSLTPQSEEAFTGGLLGEGYEEKRKLAERTEKISSKPQNRVPQSPFTEGPSLLNGGVSSPQESAPEPKPWFPSATEHTAQSRSKSVRNPRRMPIGDVPVASHSNMRQKPQPLVNLTNFPEPPRWRENIQASQGHGHKAPTGNNGPLINFATGGQAAQVIGPGLIRSATRAGNKSHPPLSSSATASSLGNGGGRPRSRSSAGLQRSSSRSTAPPIPPLPIRSLRREQAQPMDRSRGRDPQPREPLINLAGYNGPVRE